MLVHSLFYFESERLIYDPLNFPGPQSDFFHTERKLKLQLNQSDECDELTTCASKQRGPVYVVDGGLTMTVLNTLQDPFKFIPCAGT